MRVGMLKAQGAGRHLLKWATFFAGQNIRLLVRVEQRDKLAECSLNQSTIMGILFGDHRCQGDLSDQQIPIIFHCTLF